MFESVMTIFLGLVALFVVVGIYILLPWSMAKSRFRNGLGWVVLSLLFSPILACLLLLLLGENPKARPGQ